MKTGLDWIAQNRNSYCCNSFFSVDCDAGRRFSWEQKSAGLTICNYKTKLNVHQYKIVNNIIFLT